MALTVRAIAARKKPGLDGDGGNLFLKVDVGGSKSWVFRHQVGGKVRTYGLGPVRTVGLSEARARAAAIRKQLLDGVDPRAAKVRTVSFDEARDRYIDSHKAGWRNAKHVRQWAATLATYAGPVFGKLPVNAIDTGMVMRVLSPIWATKNATAFRVRGRIEAILSWAEAHGYRSGKNPAQWRGTLDHLLPAPTKVRPTRHHAAMPYAELPAFMTELRGREGIAARALEFLILTGARTSEVLGARWSEIDRANKVWTIPPERMKSGREHRVPLSARCIAIVEGTDASNISIKPRHSPTLLVFPGPRLGRPLGPMALLALLDRMGRDVTAHGFRSSFRDWAAEETSYPNHVIEMALAHAIGSAVEAAYRRGDMFDKRRPLMTTWADYCDSRDTVKNVAALR